MADDTDLVRPARHERRAKPSKDQDPRQLVEIGGEIRRPCRDCGTEVCFTVPERPPPLARIAQRMADGELPVLCDDCVDALDAADSAEEERRDMAAIREKRLQVAGIPGRFEGETWEGVWIDDDRRKAVEEARAWSEAKGARAVLLHGDVGRGKSHMAAVAAAARTRVSDVRWLNVAELLSRLSLPFADPDRAAALRMLEARRGVALVLDDFDKCTATDFAVQPLYIAVNSWVEERQPLFVTLNADVEELPAMLGPRFGRAIASRLAGYCECCMVGGSDRRLR